LGSIPHAIRRRSVYHFRRAVPLDLRRLLGRRELTCSLKTTCTKAARIAAQALYIASERLFDSLRIAPMLSEDQLARLVQDFYATLIERENAWRLKGGALTEQARQARIAHYTDVATTAKGSLARNELKHAWFVTEAMLRKGGFGDGLDAAEKNQARQAILRAAIDLADHLKAQYEGEFNHEPRDKLLRIELSKLDGSNRATTETNNSDVPEQTKPVGPNLSAVAEKFRAEQIKTRSWDNQTASQAGKSFQLFIEINGDLPIDSYTREHSARFKEKVQSLPADYGKASMYRDLTVTEIIAKYEASCIGKRTPLLSQKTVKRHFSALSTLWDALKTEGRLKDNIFRGFKFGNTKRPNQQRDMWTEDDLRRLFATPLWQGCKSEGRRTKPGKLIIRDEKFWLPLIAIFSGLRQEEICQLHLEDIREEDGIRYFDINGKPPRQLKNENAVRRVPIHDELIRLGLLDHIERMKSAREERIFPNLKPGGADDRLGHGYTKWFTRYRRDSKVYRPLLDFHSFRHTATTLLQRAEVHVPLIDELTGHAGAGETARYTKGLGLKKLHEAINKISIGVDDLKHLYPVDRKQT
jgi:integrase